MNKELYLKRLRSLIRDLPNDERKRIIEFYREIIEDKIESGQSEAQAVAELGDVYMLAQKILTENPNRKRRDGNRVAGIVVASVFGVLIIASIVVNALNIVNFRVAANTYSQNVSGESGTAEEKTVTASVSEIKYIDVDAENKQIEVKRGTGQDITMTFQTDNSQSYTFTTANGVMKLVNRYHYGLNIFNFFSWNNHNQIVVNVPQSYVGEVYLNSSNGSILVNDMEQVSKLTCDTSNGAVRLNNVHADSVIADTSNASIELTQVTASGVNANSSNGKITLNDLASPNVILDTSNGAIRGSIIGDEQDYNIHTSTSNGRCSPSNRFGGTKQLTATTSNGDIELTFTR